MDMEAWSSQRKLTAILSADVVGFSRLMRDDEASTVRTLAAYKRIISGLVSRHRGRIVDDPGDNLLAEFGSVVEAVQCAISIQDALEAENARLPENRRMRFRVGVNLGDVIEEGGRIYGDGVNITSRLQSVTPPGGVCISKPAFEQVENKLPVRCVYLGEQKAKNVPKPLEVYQVLTGQRPAKTHPMRRLVHGRRTRMVAATATAAALAIIGVAIWSLYWRTDGIEPASREKMSFPLPEMPSIAVLPFANRSEDPKGELLCDGVTDNIISALSRVPQLLVIARGSSATYKGIPAKISEVSESFGVQYVLEGSIQRSGDRLRVTTHLFDALKGAAVWGETYDREPADIFALQDEIVFKVLAALRINVNMEPPHALKYFKGTEGLDCYFKILQAGELISRWSLEDNNAAKRLIEESLAQCPDTPYGYTQLGWHYHHAAGLAAGMPPEEAIARAIELARKAMAADDTYSGPHVLLCSCYMMTGEIEKALPECERGVSLNPGSMDALSEYAWTLVLSGRYPDAIRTFQNITRRNPYAKGSVYNGIGLALLLNGQVEESLSALKAGLRRSPNDMNVHLLLSVVYTVMGRPNEAATATAEVLRLNPKYSVERVEKRWSALRDPVGRDLLLNTIRRTGLPEKLPPS
jgi:adenylate cyclase